MRYGRELGVMLTLLALTASSYPAWSFEYPPVEFHLVGAAFDDGGMLTGGFNFNFNFGNMPLPQFYNIQITTSLGSTLPGSSNFTISRLCYNDRKKFVCAPGDDFLLYVETGTPGEPGYDLVQLAMYFAPNDLVGQVGVLDTKLSYEIGCTQSGCFSRYITAGAIRLGTQ